MDRSLKSENRKNVFFNNIRLKCFICFLCGRIWLTEKNIYLENYFVPFLSSKIVKKFSRILFRHSDLNRIQIRNHDLAELDHVELQDDIHTNNEDLRKLRSLSLSPLIISSSYIHSLNYNM